LPLNTTDLSWLCFVYNNPDVVVS